MELHVLEVVDKSTARKILQEDWVKRTGASLREGVDGSDRQFLVLKCDEETLKKLLNTGAFKVPDDEEKLIEIIKQEEEASSAGVGLLGL